MKFLKHLWRMICSDPIADYARECQRVDKIIAQGPEHPQYEKAVEWRRHAHAMLRAFWYGKEATDASPSAD